MPLFRKKPVVIEADHYDGSLEIAQSLSEKYLGRVGLELDKTSTPKELVFSGRLQVSTLEGTVFASPGDWIIQGVNGEVYPCKPDVFEKTYEAVTEGTDGNS
jgi:hypothetical protein